MENAKHLMMWITKEDLDPLEKPDFTRPSRQGGHPDFIFEDSRQCKYALEITRLLSPKLRSLEKAVMDKVCAPVEHLLPGTYALDIQLPNPIGEGRIAPVVLDQTKREIAKILKNGTLQDTQQLSTGFVIWKARDKDNRLVPRIITPLLPHDLTDAHPFAKELRAAFEKLVNETDLKFLGYAPYRILLIGISQSGLDIDFHAGRFKDGKGILLTWMDDLCQRIVNIDAIFLDPGVNVWSSQGKVMTGHKYVDSQSSSHPELWRRPNVGPLLIKFLAPPPNRLMNDII